MNTVFKKLSNLKATQKKSIIWLYQFDSESTPRTILKQRGRWHYTTRPGSHGNDQASSTLEAAKGDIKYAGAKVWSVLVCL